MFEGLFQPIHLLVILELPCSYSAPKSFLSLPEEWERESP